MAKYIKQEMPDMTGTGEKKAYYRLQTVRNIGMEEFVKKMTYHGGISRGTAISVLTQAVETLSELVGLTLLSDRTTGFRPRCSARTDVPRRDINS